MYRDLDSFFAGRPRNTEANSAGLLAINVDPEVTAHRPSSCGTRMTSPSASAWTSVISQGATLTASLSAPSATKNPKRSNSLAMEVRVDLSQTGFDDGDELDQPLSIMDCLGLLSCRAGRRNGAQRVHLFGVDPAGLAVPKRLGPLEPKADAARGSDDQGLHAVIRRPRLSDRPEEACGLSVGARSAPSPKTF